MASLPCQFHEDQGAVFIGTFLETGMSLTVCQECLRDFFATTLEEMSGIPITAILQMDPAQFSAEAEQAAEESAPAVDDETADDHPEPDADTETTEPTDDTPDAA
jgi:hypothetical protein